MGLPTPFNIILPIFCVVFLLALIYAVVQCWCRKSRSERYQQQYPNAVAAGPNTVPNINAQFNHPIAATTHSFAPAANYPMGPGHQYPANLTPHPYQQHYQNFNSGADSTYTSSPMPPMMQPTPQPNAPPSYTEVVGQS